MNHDDACLSLTTDICTAHAQYEQEYVRMIVYWFLQAYGIVSIITEF